MVARPWVAPRVWGPGTTPALALRVPQPLGLLVEGPEDHDLLLPGSVLRHAHHAVQTGERGKAPRSLAQGSPLLLHLERGQRGDGKASSGSPGLGARVAFVPAARSSPGVSRPLGSGGIPRGPPATLPALSPGPRRPCCPPADRLLLPLGLSVEEQVQEGARGVRDHGEREPPPPGERAAGPRGRPLHRRQVKRGTVVGRSRGGRARSRDPGDVPLASLGLGFPPVRWGHPARLAHSHRSQQRHG